mgnify:CR=1 FL=1
MAAAEDLISLLEEELEAACDADVDRLFSLQEQKVTCLAELSDQDTPRALLVALREQARSNIRLIRHLVTCYRGIVQPEDQSSYNAHGSTNVIPLRGRVRGAL